MPESPSTSPPSSPFKVLVVDDDSDIRDLLRLTLEGEGYEVLEAAHGLDALALLLDPNHVAVVCLDARMPVLDGWGFAARLRSDPLYAERKDVPIIVVTAASRAQEWAAQIGAVSYLAKPFSLEDARRVVRAFLPPPAPAALDPS